jgi:O-antigen/teichoic acid export membrane protein
MTLAAPFERLRSRFAGRLTGFRYGISALDQIALSVFAFLLNLCLVRALSAPDFGVVSLWVAVSLLALSVQAMVAGLPLNVHLPATSDPARAQRLEAAVGVTNLIAIVLVAAAVVAVNALVDAEWTAHDILTAFAIPVFICAGMYREFYRTVAFSRRNMTMLLWIDIPYLAFTSLALGAMLAWPEELANLATAFLALSVGCIVSQLCLRARFRFPRPRPFDRGWPAEYRQVCGDVGWGIVGVFATHLQSRSYIYVTVKLVGLAQLASLSVIGLLFRPMRVLLHAWMRTVLPGMSAQLARGELDAFERTLRQGLVAAVLGSVVWFMLLYLGWSSIERFFLAGRYPDAWSLMWPWAIAACANVMAFTMQVPLQAAREFKFMAYSTMINAPLTAAATVAIVIWRGYTWAMYAAALGDMVALGMYIARYRAVRQKILTQPDALAEAAVAAAADRFQ